MVKTIHVRNGKLLLPSYGLFFSLEKTKIFITTDIQFFLHRYADYYQEADLILHYCETDKTKPGVHAHFQQLMNINPAIKSKMWLYHYSKIISLMLKMPVFKALIHGDKHLIFDYEKR